MFGAAGAACLQGLADTPPGSIEEKVLAAHRAKQGAFRIPAGTYRLDASPKGTSHLSFHDMTDFEIDARGVNFLFSDVTRGGIEFVNCRNVRFHGASLQYSVPPFTQGTVTSVAPDRSWYTLEVDPGYPANLSDTKYFPAAPVGCLFDARTRRLKAGAYDIGAVRIEQLGPTLFRFYGKGPEAVGDLAAFRGSGRHNITLIECGQMDVRDVTIYNSGMFGVWEGGGEGKNYYSLQIKRGPAPPGAKTEPLYSTCADGFHSSRMRKGPTVENCSFEGMPDDGIAIHGIYALVLQRDGNTLVINRNSFQPGDPLLLFDFAGSPAGEAAVKSVTPAPSFRTVRPSKHSTVANNTAGPYFAIVLDRTLPADFDCLCSNPNAIGSGYVVRNNTIRDHRARGMLLKAHNGLVEGNTIDGSSISGIVLSPELWWNEACYSRNVTIRNNVIRNLPDNPRSFGAIAIAAITSRPVPGAGHQHITFENNQIDGSNSVNLLITSAEDVSVSSNRFGNAQRAKVAVAGSNWGEDPTALVYITESKNIRFASNTAPGLGAANEHLIETTATATQIQSDWKHS
ncbi:MAG TPA: right-handed parallel beta-helix repeat-containing protein [Bryobacteraceae bacterium]|nr:right-handed parallel beta-helix repeat-containing protein [Bryobacteraceae bacterium]